MEPRKEPNFSYRLLRAIYPAFRMLFPNQVIRADDLARAMVDVVVQKTAEREGRVFENRDIRAMIGSFSRELEVSGEGQQLQEKVEVLDSSMEQSHRISVFAPLGLSLVVLVCTIIIYLAPLRATVNLIRRERRRGHVGTPWTDLGIFARVVFYASLTHLLEIAFWAVLFMICGEFSDFGTAFYHSAVNYTSLGYGDLIMSPSWRLLGPLETANGMLLFGVSTAMIFAVMLWLIQARFTDLKV